MDAYKQKVVDTLGQPKNHTQILLRVFHQSRINNTASRDEVMCKTCLTSWCFGQFSLKMIHAKHRKRKQRKLVIERLQKRVKSKDISPADGRKLNKKIRKLQRQDDHIAVYKCFCKSTTQVQTKIPNENKKHDQEKLMPAPAAKLEEKQEKILTNKPKKEKGKKKKTAGLIIPPKKKETEIVSPSATIQRNNIRHNKKLATMLAEASKSKEPQIKFNQFFK